MLSRPHKQTYMLALLLDVKSKLKFKLVDILFPLLLAPWHQEMWSGSQAQLSEMSFVFSLSWRMVRVGCGEENSYK